MRLDIVLVEVSHRAYCSKRIKDMWLFVYQWNLYKPDMVLAYILFNKLCLSMKTDGNEHFEVPHQLLFVRRIHHPCRINSSRKWPVMQKAFNAGSSWIIRFRYWYTRNISQCLTLSHTLGQISSHYKAILPCINSSPPWQNGRHFAEDIFKLISINENFCISIELHCILFLGVKLTICQHWFR